MKLLEHQGKQLLAGAGIRVPQGQVARTADEAEAAATTIGTKVVVKAQVPVGKRGKSGAILFVEDPAGARRAAEQLLGSDVGGFRVDALVIEECADIDHELYAAVLNDSQSKGPLVLFSTAGGMDIEEVNASSPQKVSRLAVDITEGLDQDAARALVGPVLPETVRDAVAQTLVDLYELYRRADADLAEINPLAVTRDGEVIALDAKVSIDAGSLKRQEDLVSGFQSSASESSTALEDRGRELGFQFIELDGDVGVLANGAGLTMTTLDVINHYGGRPANFLEIGGDSYTKATPALQLVLSNPRVRSLLVNFCGAFARTDVMAEGVVGAIEELRPEVPIFFTIHGTGEKEAISLVSERLGIEPYDLMDDAVRAAVAAATEAGMEVS